MSLGSVTRSRDSHSLQRYLRGEDKKMHQRVQHTFTSLSQQHAADVPPLTLEGIFQITRQEKPQFSIRLQVHKILSRMKVHLKRPERVCSSALAPKFKCTHYLVSLHVDRKSGR